MSAAGSRWHRPLHHEQPRGGRGGRRRPRQPAAACKVRKGGRRRRPRGCAPAPPQGVKRSPESTPARIAGGMGGAGGQPRSATRAPPSVLPPGAATPPATHPPSSNLLPFCPMAPDGARRCQRSPADTSAFLAFVGPLHSAGKYAEQMVLFERTTSASSHKCRCARCAGGVPGTATGSALAWAACLPPCRCWFNAGLLRVLGCISAPYRPPRSSSCLWTQAASCSVPRHHALFKQEYCYNQGVLLLHHAVPELRGHSGALVVVPPYKHQDRVGGRRSHRQHQH